MRNAAKLDIYSTLKTLRAGSVNIIYIQLYMDALT